MNAIAALTATALAAFPSFVTLAGRAAIQNESRRRRTYVTCVSAWERPEPSEPFAL